RSRHQRGIFPPSSVSGGPLRRLPWPCVGGGFLATSGSCAVAPAGRDWGGSEDARSIMSDEFDALDATEKAGIRATLIRCRGLAAKIANKLRNKRPEQLVDELLLADLYASLEHAARLLERKSR